MENLNVGDRVWRLGQDYFRDPSTPHRTGTITEVIIPQAPIWTATDATLWRQYSVQWDDGELGTNYFNCGLNKIESTL